MLARSRLGWEPPPGRLQLFRPDIHDVAFIRYDDGSVGATAGRHWVILSRTERS